MHYETNWGTFSDKIWKAIEDGRKAEATDTKWQDELLSASDRLASGGQFDVAVPQRFLIELQQLIGQQLAKAENRHASLVHLRALKAIPADDVDDIADQFDALVEFSEKSGDLHAAIRYQRQRLWLATEVYERDSWAVYGPVIKLIELLQRQLDETNLSAEVRASLTHEILQLQEQIKEIKEASRKRAEADSETKPQAYDGKETDDSVAKKAAAEKDQSLADDKEAQYPHHELMRVLFWTTRKRASPSGLYDRFVGEPEPDGAVHCGMAHVRVPISGKPGQVLLSARGAYYNPNKGSGIDRYLMSDLRFLERLDDKTKRQWLAHLSHVADERRSDFPDRPPEALLYVHGFNTRFNEAMEVAAQLGSDLDVRGPVTAFSWPSLGAGTIGSYVSDLQKVNTKNAQLLADMMMSVGQNTRAGRQVRPTIIAHSMGARLLCEALPHYNNALSAGGDMDGKLLQNVVIASPDTSISELTQALPVLAKLAVRVTVYCSPWDLALIVGRRLGADNGLRAGQSARHLAEGLAKPLTNVDIINTHPIADLSYTTKGHSDYRTTAIDDLCMSHWLCRPASKRQQLLDPLGLEESRPYFASKVLDDWSEYRKEHDSLFLTERHAIRRALQITRRQGNFTSARAEINLKLSQIPKGSEADSEGLRIYHQKILDALDEIERTH